MMICGIPRRAGIASLLLVASLCAACGVGPPPGASLWFLPPREPRPLGPPIRPEPAAAIHPPSLGLVSRADPPAHADPLHLRELLQTVARTYPRLAVAEQQRVIAQARQLAALGNFDVELRGFATSDALGFYQNETAGVLAEQRTGLWGTTLYGGYRLGNGDFDPTFDGDRLTNRGGEFAAGVRVPLLRGGATDERRRELWSSDIDRELAEAAAAALRLEATREASEAYWRWVAAGRRLQVARSLFALAQERQSGLVTRVRRGDLPEIEEIDNERLVVERRALLIAAQRAVDRAAIALSLFFRDSAGDPVIPDESRLPDAFPQTVAPREADLERDVSLALAQRPELQRLAQERDRLLVDRDYFANEALPRLDLKVEGSQDLDRWEPTPTKGEFELFLGVEMMVSLQNRRAHGRVEEVDGRLMQIAYEARLEFDRIAAEVRDSFSQLKATFERAAQASLAVELAERVAAGERRRFDLGDSTVLVLNLREEAAAEAQLRGYDALRAYWIAVARYRAAVGEDPTALLGSAP